ncbi:matrixin family metalloprotease [Acinetobacter sp. ASP199]|uniref:matrixin family metalloprotease n=1 Tax=unclassified Acinetobacter TaxID=196816 RepID=UPI001F621F5F|nr:matrixin family metalloprotease [Acinetobacter sp. ASP199]UNT59279.1 matrixin family metalloprotease [Acinetobacter sp. ASP199]
MRILYLLMAVVLLLAGFLHLQTQSHPQLKFNSLSDRLTHPFDTRLRFKVEQVDPGFGLTREEVIQLAQEAVEIWHRGTGRNDLMVYDDNAQLSIKLIYDHRQQEYDALKQTTQKLLRDEAQYQRQAENLTASQDHLDQQQRHLLEQRNLLQIQFQQLLQRRNQPGLSAYQREQLQQEFNELQLKSERFQREAEYLQQQQLAFNTQVSAYQSSVQSHQNNITLAQQRFPPRQFHKGVFKGDEIHVYQFDAQDDLRLTLAHELGHALGLLHHEDPEALMYPILGEQKLENFELRPADKTLLYTRKS